MNRIGFLCCAILLVCLGKRDLWADSVTVYTNEAAWQTAATNDGANPLATVSLEASAWTQTIYSPPHPGITVTDTSTASNGTSVMLVNEAFFQASEPVFTNDSVQFNETILDGYYFQFGQNLFALGAYFSVPVCHPDALDPCPVVYLLGGEPVVTGFLGFTSAEPLPAAVFYADCSAPGGSNCGESITISDLQLSTTPPTPTPEPGYSGLAIVAILSFLALRKHKTRSQN